MSLNIQTATGLLEISTKVTKEKVIEALGYEPVNSTHASDTTLHVTSEEREAWNNKSDFSGVYADLEGKPNIEENDSGSMVVADNNGNIIMQVDENGLATTNVNAKTININGEDLGERLDSIEAVSLPNIVDNETGDLTIADKDGNTIVKVDASGLATTGVTANTLVLAGEDIGTKIDGHIDNSVAHITSAERTKWNNKSDFSGDYNDLKNKPNITDDGSGEVVYNDSNGYTIAKINANGFETTTVTAKSAIINGVDVVTKIDANRSDINENKGIMAAHIINKDVHITADEREMWNNKSDFSGDYNDLTNAPNIKEDNSGEVVYADESGNVIAKISEAGFETTQVIADDVIAGGVNVGSTLSSHVNDKDIHITADERTAWNAKATTTYVDNKVAALVDSSPATLDTLNELAAALGDDPNFATTVASQIGSKASQTDLDTHVSNKNNPHGVTAAQVGLGNVDNTSDINKPVSTAQQAALDSLKAELSENIVSESDEWIIADEDGNIVARVDENGLETTTVIAKKVMIGDVDVETSLAGKSDDGHTHTITANASDDDVIILTGTNGTDAVTYSASHATSGVSAGTYKSVTVNEYGHVTAASNPTTLDGYGITDAVSKTDFDGHTDRTDNPHSVTASQVGLGNVDNTSDADKPVSTAQKEALDTLKSELSESIVSESKEWIIADEDGNVIAKVDGNGLETTTVTAKAVVVNGTDVETTLSNKANKATTLSGYGIVDAASKEHTHVISDVTNLQSALDGKADNNHTHDEYLVEGDIANLATTTYVNEQLDLKADSNHAHDEYLVADDISGKADKSYVDEQLATKSDADHTHDEYLVADDISGKADKSYVDDELAKKAEKEHSHEEYLVLEDIANKADKSYVDDELAKKANENHTHDEYLVDSDIAGKADKSYVDEELAKKADKEHSHEEYLEASDIAGKADKSYVDEELAKKASSEHSHNEYLIADDISGKADISYVDEEIEAAIEEAKTDATNKDIVILAEAQKSIDTVQTAIDTHTSKTDIHITDDERTVWNNKADKSYVDEELAKKVNSAKISHSTESVSEGVTITNGELSIVVDAYTKAETLQKISDKITEINGGESAGEVLGVLNSYKETNDARVGAVETKNSLQDDEIAEIKKDIQSLNTNKADKTVVEALDVAYKAADAELTIALSNKVDATTYNSDKATFATTFATKSEIPTVPSNVSAFTNDAGYLTEHQSLDGFATEDFVTGKIAEAKLESSNVDLSDYATTAYVDEKLEDAKADASNKDAVVLLEAQNGIASVRTYVDEQLETKADIEHIHEQYLIEDDIADKADRDELHEHTNKAELDKITEGKVAYWDAKSDFSGAYADLEGAPNITENNSGDLIIADKDGNIIFKSDGAGFETTTLTAKNVVINKVDSDGSNASFDVETRIDEVSEIANTAKSNAESALNSLSNYYTKTEIDSLELITVADIDRICGVTA